MHAPIASMLCCLLCWLWCWPAGAAAANVASTAIPAVNAAQCAAGKGSCCPDGSQPVDVPPTRGLSAGEAQHILDRALFRLHVQVIRPSDGMTPGRVMGTNPYARSLACTGQRTYIYVAGPDSRTTLRNFHGDGVAQARTHLTGKLAGRMFFRSCKTELGLTPDDPLHDMQVVGQQPVEGTPLDDPWRNGALELTVTDAFVHSLVGQTLAQAQSVMSSRPHLLGWGLKAPASAQAASAPTQIVAVGVDREACQIKVCLVRGPADGSTCPDEGRPDGGSAPLSPGEPVSPAIPLTAGVLAGLAAARVWRSRSNESDALAATALNDASPASSIRVRPDIPAGPQGSVQR
jgi:hypothetical protein